MPSLLDGKRVVIVVMAPSYTSLHKRLTAQGGRNCRAVNKSTDYVVSNGFRCKELRLAKQLGVRIITEVEFEGLLAGKPLDEGDDDRSTTEERSSIEEAFGRVRSVFASRADASVKWFLLIEELDRCEPERREELVAYIESAMDHAASQHPFDGIFGLEGEPMPDARVMGSLPEVWRDAMAADDRDVKYRLVREVDMFYSGMSATFLTSLLKHKDVHRIERVRFMQNTKPSKTMLKTVCTHHNMHGLTHLALGKLNMSVVGWLREYASKARSLRTLDMSNLNHRYSERGEPSRERFEFLDAPLFSTLEAVIMPLIHFYEDSPWLLDTLTDASRFERLRRLTFYAPHRDMLRHMREDVLAHAGVGRRITHLEFLPWTPERDIEEQLRALFSTARPDALEHLGLCDQLVDTLPRDTRSHITKTLYEILPESPLIAGLKSLALGVWNSPALLQKLGAHHPDLEVRVGREGGWA